MHYALAKLLIRVKMFSERLMNKMVPDPVYTLRSDPDPVKQLNKSWMRRTFLGTVHDFVIAVTLNSLKSWHILIQFCCRLWWTIHAVWEQLVALQKCLTYTMHAHVQKTNMCKEKQTPSFEKAVVDKVNFFEDFFVWVSFALNAILAHRATLLHFFFCAWAKICFCFSIFIHPFLAEQNFTSYNEAIRS
jgi:hypothetical protein